MNLSDLIVWIRPFLVFSDVFIFYFILLRNSWKQTVETLVQAAHSAVTEVVCTVFVYKINILGCCKFIGPVNRTLEAKPRQLITSLAAQNNT